MTGVEKPEWFERVLDAYEHDGADAAWMVLVAAREHNTRLEQVAELIEQMICDDAERMRGLNVGLWRVDEKKLAALRLLRGGEA